jgi:uncharacterized protein YheU (UPF0270 family)
MIVLYLKIKTLEKKLNLVIILETIVIRIGGNLGQYEVAYGKKKKKIHKSHLKITIVVEI